MHWIKKIINVHHEYHPETMETEVVTQYLTFLIHK
ncbi:MULTISPECIES: hypothetical protein [unclassified Shewanella]